MNIKIPSNKKCFLLFIGCVTTSEVMAKGQLNEEAVFDSINKIVAEHKIYATCLSLDSTSYQLVLTNWEREVDSAIEKIKSYKPSLTFIAKFKSAVATENLIDKNLSLADAMEYCHKNEEQVKKFYEFGHSRLSDAIGESTKSN